MIRLMNLENLPRLIWHKGNYITLSSCDFSAKLVSQTYSNDKIGRCGSICVRVIMLTLTWIWDLRHLHIWNYEAYFVAFSQNGSYDKYNPRETKHELKSHTILFSKDISGVYMRLRDADGNSGYTWKWGCALKHDSFPLKKSFLKELKK